MNKLYTNNFAQINLYSDKQCKSKIVSQMIYGDSFSIIKKSKNIYKIKIKEDGYMGFIKRREFPYHIQPTHKVSNLSANFYSQPNIRNKIGKLTFGSKVKVTKRFKEFSKFGKSWIKSKDLKNFKFKEKNLLSRIQMFKNIKYKWGGKTFKGIDCSGLVQIFFNFNNKFLPRDTKDQIKYFKNNVKLNKIKKYDIIFWKGHVAVVISKKKLIHAYGPLKKTVIMDILKTINKIKKTAKLDVLIIKRP